MKIIKRLAHSFKEYKKYAILTPILVVIEVIFDVLVPYLMSYLVDFGIECGDMKKILIYGLAIFIMAILILFVATASGVTSATASAGLATNLRTDMYNNVQTFSFSNIDRFSTSSIVTRMTTDVTHIQFATQMALKMAVKSPVMLLFSLIATLTIDKRISLIFLGCIPILGISVVVVIKKAHPLFEKAFKIVDKLNSVVQENLRGVRVVKSFNRQSYESKKFDSVADGICQTYSKADKIMAFTMPVMQLCVYTCLLLISWIGAKLIIESGNDPAVGFTTGQLVSLISYTMQILVSLLLLGAILIMVTISRASAERISELLNEKADIVNCDNPKYDVKDGSILFENVSFSYSNNERKALKNINLKINSGETVGIIGGTGSSKSSLVQLIPRLYDVTEGLVAVGGEDVRYYDLETLRNSVAMVLQKNVLFSGTIKDNLKWGNENATDEEIIQACKLAQADEFIQSFPDGYNSMIEQGGSNVSGGQRQRLCIARALLKKPKILILDDSTSAVDTKTDALIRSAMREYIPETTKIIIAQRISSVQNADKIIVMDNGMIMNVGTHEELLVASAIYKEIYDSQVNGGGLDA